MEKATALGDGIGSIAPHGLAAGRLDSVVSMAAHPNDHADAVPQLRAHVLDTDVLVDF